MYTPDNFYTYENMSDDGGVSRRQKSRSLFRKVTSKRLGLGVAGWGWGREQNKRKLSYRLGKKWTQQFLQWDKITRIQWH